MKYRKKPIIIEAMQWDGSFQSTNTIAKWIGKNITVFNGSFQHIVITTLEGNMRAEVGDWIIRGINGEFYPCKPNIFERTYELVHD